LARFPGITDTENSKKSLKQPELAFGLFLTLHIVAAILSDFQVGAGTIGHSWLLRTIFFEYLAGETSIYLEQLLAQGALLLPAGPRLVHVGPTLLTSLGNATSDNPARRLVYPKAVPWKCFTLLHCRSPHVRAGTYGPANKHAKRVPSNLGLC